MRKITFFAAAISIFASTAALAEGSHEEDSRAFQIARRVAAQENEKDLPSRAVWMGSRVARNARNLASFKEDEGNEHGKKSHQPVRN